MSAPQDDTEPQVWAVTAKDANRTMVLYVVDAPTPLIAQSMAILQLWMVVSDGAPVDVSTLATVIMVPTPHARGLAEPST